MTGSLVPFTVPWQDPATHAARPANDQAREILNRAVTLRAAGAIGVGITYSANWDQTKAIRKVYADGGWNTGTGGSNQAEVMTAMERLEGTAEFSVLQNRMRIVPITTMYYGHFTNGMTMDDVIAEDMAAIHKLITDGWTVLGWINQPGSDQFAVGGGVAKRYYEQHPDRALSPTQSAHIQAELTKMAAPDNS